MLLLFAGNNVDPEHAGQCRRRHLSSDFCLQFFVMLRFWTRPLRPAFTSFSSRAMSQSTAEFVSLHRAILFGIVVPQAHFLHPFTSPYASISLNRISVLIDITALRIKSSMPLSQRWTLRSRTSSTRRHGGSTLVSNSLPRRCDVFIMSRLCPALHLGVT